MQIYKNKIVNKTHNNANKTISRVEYSEHDVERFLGPHDSFTWYRKPLVPKKIQDRKSRWWKNCSKSSQNPIARS